MSPEEVCVAFGIAFLVVGVGLVYVPAGLIVLGLALVAVGFAWALGRPDEEEEA